MGGCCSSNDGDAHTELATTSLPQPVPSRGLASHRVSENKVNFPPTPSVSEAAITEFMKKAEAGFGVLVLLSTGHGIECKLRVDSLKRVVELSREELRRELPFSSITKVLHTPEELAKIKTEAKLDANCSALYTAADSSCIVFSFESPEESQAFVAAAFRLVSPPKP